MKFLCPSIPNLPWEARPSGCPDLVWRYTGNPIIGRRALAKATGCYNSAVVPFEGKFAGVFRVDYKDRMPHLHTGWSDDGIHWTIEPEEIALHNGDPEKGEFHYAYDPRVVKLEDWYYVIWCMGYHGPTIGLARTKDFRSYEQLDNLLLPYNRNGVFFPRKINGKYAMLNRPSDTGHTPFGDIFFSESHDLVHWGKHRHVMGKSGKWWEDKKIGPGPAPIETDEGWLAFYHGVAGTCNGYIYAMGAMILDREKPWVVRHRLNQCLLLPETPYELTGYVPGVVFPVAALCDGDTGRIAIYYGSADTVSGLAFCQAQDIVEFIKRNSLTSV